LKRKTDEMKQSFVVRIKEKEAELKEAENDIHAKFEALKRKNQDEKKRLEEERRLLEEEIGHFTLRKTSVLQAATLQPGITLGGKQKKK
jgi:septin 6/8/11